MGSIEATVARLELELLEPAVRADAQRLDALLAEDFLEVGASGRSFAKADVLARLPGEHGVTFSVGTMQTRVLAPDVALVTYAVARTHLGQATYSLRSSLWVKGAEGWRMRYHQGTSIAALPPNNSSDPKLPGGAT
jgi:hypothetical protein